MAPAGGAAGASCSPTFNFGLFRNSSKFSEIFLWDGGVACWASVLVVCPSVETKLISAHYEVALCGPSMRLRFVTEMRSKTKVWSIKLYLYLSALFSSRMQQLASKVAITPGAYLGGGALGHAPPFGQKNTKIYTKNAFLTTFS